jgi:hypothetical protein
MSAANSQGFIAALAQLEDALRLNGE